MNKPITLKEIINSHLKKNNLPMSNIAKKAQINRGIVSKNLNQDHNNLLSIDQLDLITEALGYQKGSFYDAYIVDFKNFKFDWRRTKAALTRFAEDDRIDLMNRITDTFNPKPALVKQVADFANELYDLKLIAGAEAMYNTVLKIETKTGSRKIAMSFYRLFKIHQHDKDNNHIYAAQFKPYIKKLELHYQLDALISLAHVYAVREEWQEVKPVALELRDLSLNLYKSKAWLKDNFSPLRPLAYYWGQSFLILGAMYEESAKYDKALECIDQYKDLSWMEGLDPAGHIEVKKLSKWAKDNQLLIEIKTGNQNAIPEYVRNLNNIEEAAKKRHIIDGLTTLIEAARKYKYSIDEILEHFNLYMVNDLTIDQELNQKKSIDPFRRRNEAKFAYQYSLYLLDRNRYNEGVEQCFRCMAINVSLDNQKGIIDAFIIFETYREYVSDQQYAEFSKMIKYIKG